LVRTTERSSSRNRRYLFAKRCFDIAFTIALLPVVLPISLLCAVAIWIDSPGPVLFFQWRTGCGGRRFRMVKFRTMVANADELKKELSHLNELSWPDFKISVDPRVTRVGALLRKSSLDELPQLLNVLKGDMSLVGPRPTSFVATTYALWQTERLEVAPGVTGLWQVSGRSDLDFDQRVALDREYIERRSFWFDLVIIFRTIKAVLVREGAY
jgi:lipopolysaccharide/colanic/teichoic acid biosynthesis glycosyltransferase